MTSCRDLSRAEIGLLYEAVLAVSTQFLNLSGSLEQMEVKFFFSQSRDKRAVEESEKRAKY